MEIQSITYRGRTVAACTPNRVFVSDEMERAARPLVGSVALRAKFCPV